MKIRFVLALVLLVGCAAEDPGPTTGAAGAAGGAGASGFNGGAGQPGHATLTAECHDWPVCPEGTRWGLRPAGPGISPTCDQHQCTSCYDSKGADVHECYVVVPFPGGAVSDYRSKYCDNGIGRYGIGTDCN